MPGTPYSVLAPSSDVRSDARTVVVAFLFLVAMPGAPQVASLLLVVRPGTPISVLVPSSDARRPSSLLVPSNDARSL